MGFAVLEGPDRLVDWGVRNVTGSKRAAILSAAAVLTDRYAPDLLVLEDVRAAGARRREATLGVVDQLARLAAKRNLPCRRISRVRLLRTMIHTGRRNAQALAIEVARVFPELADRLPAERKLWMSERYAMPIFSAVALAVTANGGQAWRPRSSPGIGPSQ
jgi:hypothetical protein